VHISALQDAYGMGYLHEIAIQIHR